MTLTSDRIADLPPLLSAADVAAEYGVNTSTVRRWCRDGRLPGARHLNERAWAIPRLALADFEPPRAGRPAS